MFKRNIIIVTFFLIIFPISSKSHVEHYKNLNNLEFDIYRNNKYIGKHTFSFKRQDNKLSVESEIDFEIKKLGVVLYKYNVRGEEVYENNNLIKFNSKTRQNKKDKYVNINVENNNFLIDGSSYKGKAPISFIIGTWWNHSIIKAKAQISAVSGRIIKQKIEFIGKEKLKVKNKVYNTLHFNISSTDKKLNKDKKLNTDVWYDEETLNLIKVYFDKKGKWEYKLVNLN
jgi:hypothetical protein|tara:strand:+ start:45 stop:728 length:684 start_codon:yes stop_codon:yes gene_type:complete